MDSRLDPLLHRDNLEYNTDLSLGLNIQQSIAKFALLPYHDIQIPLITASACLPSTLANIAPISYFVGAQGSGKSTIAEFIAELNNSPILTSASTFAAIRNHLNLLRFPFGLSHGDWTEHNAYLVFDNVNKDTFKNENLYSLFLCGYNYKTDKIPISKGDGTNYEFRVFCPKVITSIHSFYNYPEFGELQRRVLVFKFKKLESFTESEFNIPKEKINYRNLFSLHEYGIEHHRTALSNHWNNEGKKAEYPAIRKTILKLARKNGLPESINSSRWTLCLDLVTTGISIGLWTGFEDAIASIDRYFMWIEQYDPQVPPLIQILEAHLEYELASYNGMAEYITPEIPSTKILNRVAIAKAEGELDSNPTPHDVSLAMRSLGWALQRTSKGKMVWVRQ